MILRITLSLLISFGLISCATAQLYKTKATVQQAAGSLLPPSAKPGTTEEVSEEKKPLYTAKDILLYLPAPANLATLIAAEEIIPVIILGPRLSKGSSYEVLPIGLMEFMEGDYVRQKVLAIPAAPSLQVIKSPTLQQLKLNYPGVIEILSIWFENAFEYQQLSYLGVKDEQEAVQFLKRRN